MDKSEDKAPCFLSPITQFHQLPSIIKETLEHEQKKSQGKQYYDDLIKQWEYGYCTDCKQIRFSAQLLATENGIRCTKCNGHNVDAPEWVVCPHHKDTIVKCPRQGKGITKGKYGAECRDHCNFRLADS